MPPVPPFVAPLEVARSKFTTWANLLLPDEITDTITAPPPVIVDLPYELLGIFVRRHESSELLARVPLYALAEIEILRDFPPGLEEPRPLVEVPLGLLGTDHVGYASFDLTVLRQRVVAGQIIDDLTRRGLLPVAAGQPRPVLGLKHLWVHPFADPALRVDALLEGDVGPNAIVLRIDLDGGDLDGRLIERALTGMQSPSIIDWRISPSSFSLSGAVLVGEEGCESFLPANLSTQQFRFQQVARTPLNFKFREPSDLVGDRVALGFKFEYLTEWFGIGHSLGTVQYSLPLAPAERVKMAVIDWSRQDRATRQEETEFKEALVHDWTRDRTVTESVHSVLDAWQRGGSVMGGAAGSASSGALGGAISLGGAYTTSSDTRDLTANSTQRIADAFHQASSAQRELRSTVVVQGTQAEQSSAQTRVVANYNHSHALTILYYEVLRHYRVLTRLASARLALYVDYSNRFIKWDDPNTILIEGPTPEDVIIEWRDVLDAALLDPRLHGCFDAVQKLLCYRATFKKPPTFLPSDDFLLAKFLVKIKTGAGPAKRYVDAKLILKDGDPVQCHMVLAGGDAFTPPKIDDHLSTPLWHRVQANGEDWFDLVPHKLVRWGNIAKLELSQGTPSGEDVSGPGTEPDPWDIVSVHICSNAEPVYWVMADGAPPFSPLPHNGKMEIPIKRYLPGPFTPEDMLTDDEKCCIKRLKDHLAQHAFYYNRVMWAAEDPGYRAWRFSQVPFGGGAGTLLDFIENTPVEVVDNWVVFPVSAGFEAQLVNQFHTRLQELLPPSPDYVEQLLTLPARGVFAEAKLGHCNASEVIDTTRFWDWQKSPIPDTVTDISGVSPGPKGQQTTAPTPTAFPTSIINIATPPQLPDPTGLKDSLTTLSALGQLRDASGVTQLGSLLQTLSNNANALASIGARGEETKQLMDQIRQAPELTGDKKADLISKLLEGRVFGSTQQDQQQRQGQNQNQNNQNQNRGGQNQGNQNAGNRNQGGGNQGGGNQGGGNQGGGNQGGGNKGGGNQGGGNQGGGNQGGGNQGGGNQQGGVAPANNAGGGGARPNRAPLTGRVNPDESNWTLAFQDFDQVGPIAAVWGSMVQTNGDIPETIRREAPEDGVIELQSRRINDAGKMFLNVQLDNGRGTVLSAEAPYAFDAAMTSTANIRPRTAEYVVEEATEIDGRAKALENFATDFPGEEPVHLVLADSNEIQPAAAGDPVTTQFRFVALREGLDIS